MPAKLTKALEPAGVAAEHEKYRRVPIHGIAGISVANRSLFFRIQDPDHRGLLEIRFR